MPYFEQRTGKRSAWSTDCPASFSRCTPAPAFTIAKSLTENN